MAKKRPGVIVTIAIFHFIAVALGLCGFGFSMIGIAARQMQQPEQMDPQSQVQLELQKKLEAEVPGMKAYEYGSLGLNLIFTITLLISGIGLLSMKPWSRTLSIFYGVVSFCKKLAPWLSCWFLFCQSLTKISNQSWKSFNLAERPIHK